MKSTLKHVRFLAFHNAAALIQQMDLDQLYGEGNTNTLDEEHLAQAQDDVVLYLKRRAKELE